MEVRIIETGDANNFTWIIVADSPNFNFTIILAGRDNKIFRGREERALAVPKCLAVAMVYLGSYGIAFFSYRETLQHNTPITSVYYYVIVAV